MAPRTRMSGLLRDPLNLLILGFLLVWGCVALFGRPIGDYGVETDFYGDFAFYAREWIAGRPSLMNGFRGPLYYIVLGLAGSLTRDLFVAAKLLSLVSAAIVIRVACALLRRLHGSSAAIAGGLLMVSSATFVGSSYRACSDLFYAIFFTGTVFFLLANEDTSIRDWALSGFLAALAYLTRYNGAVLVPAALGVALIRLRPMRCIPSRLLAFLGIWALVVAPWALYVWHQTGNPFWSSAVKNVAIEVYSGDANRAQTGGFASAVSVTSLRDVWSICPKQFLTTLTGNLGSHLWSDARELTGLPWAILACIGFVIGFRSWRNRRSMALAWIGFLTHASLAIVFYNARFMLTLLMFWAAALGSGVTGAATFLGNRLAWLRTGRTARRNVAGIRSRWIVLAPLVILSLIFTIRGIVASQNVGNRGGMPIELLDLARKARQTGARFGPDTPIAARKPHIGYYLGAPVVSIPPGLIENLRKSGIHYLLVSGSEARVYPALSLLWDPRSSADIPDGLRFTAQARIYRRGLGMGVATLYSVVDPLPWRPRAPAPAVGHEALPAGLSRADFLRLQLATWYIKWSPGRSAEPLFHLMSETSLSHPLVRKARAAAAIQSGDLDSAQNRYTEVISTNPADQEALLGLASVEYLRGRRPQCEQNLASALAVATDSLSKQPDPETIGAAYLEKMDFAFALAPLAMALDAEPTSPALRMAVIYALAGLHRTVETKRALEEMLRRFPNDSEAMQFQKDMLKAETR